MYEATGHIDKKTTTETAPEDPSKEALDALFRLRFEPKDFLKFLQAGLCISGQMKIVIHDDHITTNIVDPAHCAMGIVALKAQNNVPLPIHLELSIDAKLTAKRLQDLVKLKMPWEQIRPYILQTDDDIVSPNRPILNLTTTAVLQREPLERYLKLLDTVSDHVEMIVEASTPALRLVAKGDATKVSYDILAVTTASNLRTRGLYSLDYLRAIIKGCKIVGANELTLQFDTDFPVSVSGANGLLEASYLLAPRIENE